MTFQKQLKKIIGPQLTDYMIFCRGVGGSTTKQIGLDFNRCHPRFILGPALGGFLAARPGQVDFLALGFFGIFWYPQNRSIL